MSFASKLELLNALIASTRDLTKGPDLSAANKAKGRLIGLYQAKRYLQDRVEQHNAFKVMFKTGRAA